MKSKIVKIPVSLERPGREPLIWANKKSLERGIASRLSLVAETVGFEPTCLSLDKTISSPVPKRTFQKKAGQSGSVCP